MGTYYQHRCDRCGYAFETSGPWTFFESTSLERGGSEGERSWADHARRIGTLGISVRVFCPGCRCLVTLVLAKHILFPRHEEPRERVLESIWESHPDTPPLAQIARLPPCPHCGRRDFPLPGQASTGHRCPHCGTGTMIARAL